MTGRSVAFLRSINVGGNTATKDQLIGATERLGFANVETFLASGNVLFSPHDEPGTAPGDEAAMAAAFEEDLGFAVPTTIRTAAELTAVGTETPFTDDLEKIKGKPQVILLFDRSPKAVADAVAAATERSTPADRLVPASDASLGVIFWLPVDGISGSGITPAELTRLFGLHTVRTANTIARLVKKL